MFTKKAQQGYGNPNQLNFHASVSIKTETLTSALKQLSTEENIFIVHWKAVRAAGSSKIFLPLAVCSFNQTFANTTMKTIPR